MKRSTVNFLLDAMLAAALLGMIGTGILLRYTLPAGSGRMTAVWGLTRHEWGDVHFWLALAAVGMVVVHLSLHWGWVVSMVRCGIAGQGSGATGGRARGVAAGATALIVCAGVAGFWWSSVGARQSLAAPGAGAVRRSRRRAPSVSAAA